MILSFVFGALTGAFLLWVFYLGKRKQIKLLDEEKQLLVQEKQIVVEFMHNMVEAVVEEGDRKGMFQRIIHAAILSTGAMSAAIFERRENNCLHGVAVEGLFPPQRPLNSTNTEVAATRSKHIAEILKSETFQMGEGLIGAVAKSRRAVLISDASTDPRVVQHDDPALHVRSIIVAPVIFKEELIAVLAVANPSDGLAFTDTDFSLVESLAEQVGLAVHNSDSLNLQLEKNKLDLDIEVAGNIQNLLLPNTFPTSKSLEFAAHYTAAQKVGGDLYDIFPVNSHKIGVVVADVSGKGISASLVMAICQTNLRHLSRQEESPAKVLKAINTAMQSSMRRDMFITMIYAIIDTEGGTLTLARAGHELPLLSRRSGVESISSKGMAVGMVPPEIFDLNIEDFTLQFEKGDCLMLYTDGVTESINDNGDEYSTARLAQTLQANNDKPAQLILDNCLKDVESFASIEGQLDDITLITVKHR